MAHNVLSVANMLLHKAQQVSDGGELLTNMKLQKMLYYEQGFHLACFGTPLFDEDIEAWQYGPVVPCVYEHFKQNIGHGIEPEEPITLSLSDEEQDLFDDVFDTYNKYSAIGLMNMTHSESPWANAGTPSRGTIISKESMKAFFKTRIA